MQEARPIATLRALQAANVEFIVVGGIAAVLNGAPITTYDVDIVYNPDPANTQRLQSVLDQLNAIFRAQPARRLRPNATHLAGSGHLNLLTKYGPLDVLSFIGRDLRYTDLIARATPMEIAPGAFVQVLDLATVIAVKEQLDTDKDRAALPVLRRTLEQSKKKS